MSPSKTLLALPQRALIVARQYAVITETFGMGVNPVTGDYSQGAAGFWIENGSLANPVSEVTIAGNLKDMYASLIAADDLRFESRINSPSVMIPKMTVAGN